jgi:hypothetical protein
MWWFLSLLLLFLPTNALPEVERWGGFLQRVENAMGFGFACTEADRAEMQDIDCAIRHYAVTDPEQTSDFDHIIENLMFSEAARRAHQLAVCQGRLHQAYAEDANTRQLLHQNAYLQFQDVQRRIAALAHRRDSLERRGTVFGRADYAENRYTPQFQSWREKQVREVNGAVARLTGEIDALIARVPMGNRPPMKAFLLEAARTGQPISEQDFTTRYATVMRQLAEEGRRSTEFFTGIARPGVGDQHTYRIDHQLKSSLVRTGQIENVVHALGLNDRLANQFVCRTRARYQTGPTALRAAEIPLYLGGAYGLSRLALRAGMSTRASLGSARYLPQLGMIGLDVYEGYRLIGDVNDACFPPEYLAASLDEACTAESEVNGVFQDASIAQCLTTGILGAAPLAFVGGVRIWNRFHTRPPPAAEMSMGQGPPDAALAVTVRGEVRPLSSPARAQPSRNVGLSPAARNTLRQTRERITARHLPVDNETVEYGMQFISDPALRSGFQEAMTRLNNPNSVAAYMRQLQQDTFAYMLSSGRADLVARAGAGELDHASMLEVLRARVEARGSRFSIIEASDGTLTDEVFRQRVGQGYIIDRAFTEGADHGVYTHLIQQDYVYDIVSRVSGRSHAEIIEFMGTHQGNVVWATLFDSMGDAPVNPDVFRAIFMQDNIPLG